MLNEIINFHVVSDQLATSGQPSESQLAEIKDAGYETVINLGLHTSPEHALTDERGSVERLGMRYAHIPVQFDQPTRADLERFFEVMAENENHKVFIHCAMNYRVSAITGLYLRIQKNLAEDEAFALMNKVWEPDAVWSAFIVEMLGIYGIQD